MSACNDAFTAFLNNHVNLNQARWETLLNRVSTLNEFVSSAPDVGEHVNDDVIPSGSYARRTIIRPVAGKDYDADLLVPMDEVEGWEPKKYVTALHEAFEVSGRYQGKSTMKKRCVCVQYADNFHADLVPFVERAGGWYITHRTQNEWIRQDPTALTEWFEGQNRTTNGNLIKVIRLVKYLREHSSAEVPSVVLSVLLADRINPFAATSYNSVAATLNLLVSGLNDYLALEMSPPVVDDKSGYGENLANRWSQTDFTAFKSRLRTWTRKIQTAYEAPYAASIELWQDVFGDDFGKATDTKAAEAGLLGASGFRTSRAKGEETLADKGITERLDPHVSIRMVGRITSPKLRRARPLPRNGNMVPIGRRLEFKVDACDVTGAQYYWKVRNFGDEAVQRGMERGEISERGPRITETADFTGPHWVQVWAVKDGVAVATSRQEVTIVPKGSTS